MPKTMILLCSVQADFDNVAAQLNNGLELAGTPLVLQNAVVYQLVDNEAAAIVSVAKVDVNQVDKYLADGYTVRILSPDGATATLVKTKPTAAVVAADQVAVDQLK